MAIRLNQRPPLVRGVRSLTWVAIGLSSLVLVGCSPANLVAQGIERELPKYVGPADDYDVDIKGLRISESSAESVVAVGERVRPEGAPVIERLELALTDVVYDRAAERLSKVEGARLTAVIRTDDLSDFLETNRNVRSAEVTLRSPDMATLQVRPQLGDFALPPGITVAISGQLVGEGTQLRFDVNEVRAAGLDLSAIAAQRLSDTINPLADLEGLPIDVRITSIMVAGETIGLEVVGDPTSFSL